MDHNESDCHHDILAQFLHLRVFHPLKILGSMHYTPLHSRIRSNDSKNHCICHCNNHLSLVGCNAAAIRVDIAHCRSADLGENVVGKEYLNVDSETSLVEVVTFDLVADQQVYS